VYTKAVAVKTLVVELLHPVISLASGPGTIEIQLPLGHWVISRLWPEAISRGRGWAGISSSVPNRTKRRYPLGFEAGEEQQHHTVCSLSTLH